MNISKNTTYYNFLNTDLSLWTRRRTFHNHWLHDGLGKSPFEKGSMGIVPDPLITVPLRQVTLGNYTRPAMLVASNLDK